jgi:hypothetical protein
VRFVGIDADAQLLKIFFPLAADLSVHRCLFTCAGMMLARNARLEL